MQERLFRLAVDAVTIQANHDAGEGWRLVVITKRQDEQWADAVRSEYSRLSTEELLDVIDSELAGRL